MYKDITIFYYTSEKYDEALIYGNKSLDIIKGLSNGNSVMLADAYFNIAAILHKQNLSEKSMEYLKMACETLLNCNEKDETLLKKITEGITKVEKEIHNPK